MKLSHKVPLLIGSAVLLTAASIIIAMVIIVSKTMEESTYNIISTEAKANANIIESGFNAQLTQVWEIANRARTRGMNWEGVIRTSLLPDVPRIGVLELGLVYPDGTARYVTDNSTAQLGDLEYIIQAFKGKNVVSDILISRATGKSALMLAAPVMQNDQPGASVVGVLIARKDPVNVINEIASEIKTAYKTSNFYITNKEGTFMFYPDPKMVLEMVNPIKQSETDPSWASMGNIIREALQKQTGIGSYNFGGKDRIVSYTKIPGHDWILYASIERSEFEQDIVRTRNTISIIGIICLLVGITIAVLIGTSLTKPIIKVTHTIKDISEGEGDLTQNIKVQSKDEIGDLARYFNKLMEVLRGPIKETKMVVEHLASSSKELSSVSGDLSASSEETENTATNVASTTEQMSVNINTMAGGAEQASANANEVAGAAEQMSTNMNTIAAAIEEMSASINQIAGNADEARRVAGEATTKSGEATSAMNQLGIAAKEIGQVTDVIKKIADKTNLLALNATIEAASAGEAGKGFAVVAGEIKELANQSAQSADDISRKIEGIQGETSNAVKVIKDVSGIIIKINQSIESIAGHVEQETKASNEIASNVAQANTGAKRVASAIGEVAKGSSDIARNASEAASGAINVSHNVSNMRKVAHKSSTGASQVNNSAESLSKMAEQLRTVMSKFKV